MDLLCRLCMKTCRLHKDASENKLNQILRDLFAIQINSTDSCKTVCVKCFKIVTAFYKFYKQVKRVQKNFLYRISEYSPSIKDNDCVEHETSSIIRNFDLKNVKNEYVDNFVGVFPLNANLSDERLTSKDDSSTINHSSNVKSESVDPYRSDRTDFIHFPVETFSPTDDSSKLINTHGFLNLNKRSRNDDENDIASHLSDPLNNLECIKDTKVNSLISIKLENNSTTSNLNGDFPSEIVKNGKLILKGSSLENLIEKFYHLECDMCTDQVQFTRLLELFQHYEMKHKTKGYVICCNSKLFLRRTICYHMAQHLQPSAFQCPICQKTVSRPNTMKIHMRTHLPENKKPHKCDKCEKSYNKAKSLNDHKISHIPMGERDTLECKVCGKIFTLSNSFTTHMKTAHSKAKFLCSICGRSFRLKTNLTMHMLTHDPPDTHKTKCPKCGVMCKNKLCLRQHVKLHSSNMFKCSICEFTTPFQRRLNLHMRVKHTDMKPYCCDVCGKNFKLKKILKDHMAQHTGERKYMCKFCPKTFASSGNYYTHRKRMHAEKCNNLISIKPVESNVI